MKKVLHCVYIMNRAGQETLIMNIFRTINREETTFNFLCNSLEKGDFDDEIEALGGEVFVLPKPNKRIHILNYLYYVKALAKWLKSNRDKYDVIHVHTHHNLDVLVHLLAARKAKLKNIIIHSHNTSAPHPILNKMLRSVCNMFKSTKFACSKDAGIWLFGKKYVKRGKVTVVYNGVDLPKFTYDNETRQAYREQLGLSDYTVWGHIGRFNIQKNHEFLLDAFAEYNKLNSQSKLVLVGNGELETEIKIKIKTLSLEDNVLILGVRDDVNSLLNAFDYFVFPSLYEGLPVVMVEAELNGLSIFISDVITDEAIISDNVHKLPLCDAKCWAENIYNASSDRTSNLDYDKFNIKNTALQLENKYKKMCDK